MTHSDPRRPFNLANAKVGRCIAERSFIGASSQAADSQEASFEPVIFEAVFALALQAKLIEVFRSPMP